MRVDAGAEWGKTFSYVRSDWHHQSSYKKGEQPPRAQGGEGIPVYTHLGHHTASITHRQNLREMKQWKWKWKWKWRGTNVKNGIILCTKKKGEENCVAHAFLSS